MQNNKTGYQYINTVKIQFSVCKNTDVVSADTEHL
jgi:hypothetical protein